MLKIFHQQRVVSKQGVDPEHLDAIFLEYEKLISELKEENSSALEVSKNYIITIKSQEEEMSQLRQSIEILNGENDELLNDMNGTIFEIDEIKLQLDELYEENKQLNRQLALLSQQQDQLMREEFPLTQEEMDETISHIRSQTESKLKKAASEKLKLEVNLENIKSERDGLYETIETAMRSEKDMQKKMEEMREEIRQLQILGQQLTAGKIELKEKLLQTSARDLNKNASSRRLFGRVDKSIQDVAQQNRPNKRSLRWATFSTSSPSVVDVRTENISGDSLHASSCERKHIDNGNPPLNSGGGETNSRFSHTNVVISKLAQEALLPDDKHECGPLPSQREAKKFYGFRSYLPKRFNDRNSAQNINPEQKQGKECSEGNQTFNSDFSFPSHQYDLEVIESLHNEYSDSSNAGSDDLLVDFNINYRNKG